MSILNLKIPSTYKSMFDPEVKHVVTRMDAKGQARDSALIWLWSRNGYANVFVSERPQAAHDRLVELLQLYPKLQNSIDQRISFLKPSEVTFKEFDNAVLEESSQIEWANCCVKDQWRTLEPFVNVVTMPDFQGLSLDARVELLADIRAGRKTGDYNYTEYELVESVVTESLYQFVREFWSEIIPEKFVDNWHVKYLCDEIQSVYERVFNDQLKLDLVINISPGESKSSIASVFASAWVWKRMPSFRFIGGSYVHRLAADLSRKTRDTILSNKYQRCKPLMLREDQNAKDYFVNDTGGMRMAVGTGGVAGFHAHGITIDDPLDPNKSASTIELKAANDWICNSLSQRKVDQAKTPTILIMQRLHQNDPTDMMLKRSLAEGGGSIKHICLPAEDSIEVRPIELRKFYVDGLMDPTRLSHKVLAEKKVQGRFFYAGQYLQRPTPLEGGLFKWERLKFDVSPSLEDKKNWKRIVRYWDKAATQDAGCRTAGVKLGLDYKDRIWILDVVKGQWDSGRREEIIYMTANLDGHFVVIGHEQEGGSGGKESAERTTNMLKGFSVFADKPTGDKILRADPFSVQVNMGNVYIVKATWNYDYLEEMQHFPNSTFKDQIDASSGAFKLLTHKQPRVGTL